MLLGDDDGSSEVYDPDNFHHHVYAHHRLTERTGCAGVSGGNPGVTRPADPNVAFFYHSKKRRRRCNDRKCGNSPIQKRQKLIHEASEEDWHVVADMWKSENPPISKSSTLYRFSSELVSGKRYLRCKASGASDMAAWLRWHQKPTSYMDLSLIEVLLGHNAMIESREAELRECRSNLSHFLDTCAYEDIPAFLAAGYCIAKAKRLLTPVELTQAIQAILRLESETDMEISTLEKFVTHMCSVQWLQMTEEGLNFAHPAMLSFWESLQIPGLTRGQAVFTQICFEQLRQLGLKTILQPWFNFQNFSETHDDRSLAAYARQFWDFHYRHTETEADGIDFTYELARMMSEALIDDLHIDVTILVRKQVLDASHGLCDVYDFPVLSTILENMGADATYGKQQYLQSLPMVRWPELEGCFKLRKSGVVDEELCADSMLHFRTSNNVCSVLDSLTALNLTTSERSEPCKCNTQRNLLDRNYLAFGDFPAVTGFADVADPDQYMKLANMEDSGTYEYVCLSESPDDEDWEHIDDDDLRGMG